jgi:hypothetical protein
MGNACIASWCLTRTSARVRLGTPAKTDSQPKAESGAWHEQAGVATSRDLQHWTRYAGNPVLPNGGPASWDSRFASNPFVVQHCRLWGMCLDGKGKARELLALGENAYHFKDHDRHGAAGHCGRGLRPQTVSDLSRRETLPLLLRGRGQVA